MMGIVLCDTFTGNKKILQKATKVLTLAITAISIGDTLLIITAYNKGTSAS